MPILTIEIVAPELPGTTPSTLAAVAADALGSSPAGTWVRLRRLDPADYGEGDGGPPADAAPVFVSVVKADLPGRPDLAQLAERLATALASALAHAPADIHVLFEPPARGRIAFGGRLVE